MKNVVDMDDWLRSQGVKAVDFELMDLLKTVEHEMEVMRECVRQLLSNTTADLEAARLKLEERDLMVVTWSQRWKEENIKRVELERKLMELKGKYENTDP